MARLASGSQLAGGPRRLGLLGGRQLIRGKSVAEMGLSVASRSVGFMVERTAAADAGSAVGAGVYGGSMFDSRVFGALVSAAEDACAAPTTLATVEQLASRLPRLAEASRAGMVRLDHVKEFTAGITKAGSEVMVDAQDFLVPVAQTCDPGDLRAVIHQLVDVVHPERLDQAWVDGDAEGRPEGFAGRGRVRSDRVPGRLDRGTVQNVAGCCGRTQEDR